MLNLAFAPSLGLNGTLVEDKMRTFLGECEHFSFNKCPIYTHDGASAKFSIKWEMGPEIMKWQRAKIFMHALSKGPFKHVQHTRRGLN